MDYSKMGGPKTRSKQPRHAEHNAKGTAKNPFSKATDKAELLARMKAQAEQKKSN